MLGISYGELFLLLGATAALIGPKDLPVIARTAGRLAGRAIGYVQLARGQFESVMQQSQARQVHKELQDTMAQLEAIRYEIRSISMINPGPSSTRLVDNLAQTSASDVGVLNNRGSEEQELHGENKSTDTILKDCSSAVLGSSNLHSKATTYARLAESPAIKTGSLDGITDADKLDDETGPLAVLPVSAESTGMLPNRGDDVKGSDIILEAILEAEVAHNAKEFFAQPQNQIKYE